MAMRVANTLRTKWGNKNLFIFMKGNYSPLPTFYFSTGFPVFMQGPSDLSIFLLVFWWYTIIELGGGFILYFHPENWGRFPIWLAHIFQMGGSTTNQLYGPIGLMNISQLESYLEP